MAIITISRQFGSKGDEIAKVLAEKLGYKLVDRKVLRKKILDLGCSEEKMRKFDGLKPGFFASFSKSKDEYLYYLRTAMISEVSSGNCVVVGRGSFLILKDIVNCTSFRIYEDRKLRAVRVMKKVDVPEKDALKAVKKADWHQYGFHRSFFKARIHDNFLYDMWINSGNSEVDAMVDSIIAFTKTKITSELEKKGQEQLDMLSLGQTLTNMLIFTYGVDIDDFRIDIEGNKIVLNGVASLRATVERAINILELEIYGFEIISKVRVVQDSIQKTR